MTVLETDLAGRAQRLTRMFDPASIAVVGASDSAGNLGGVAVGYLRRFGYAGAVYPVNPGRETVGGLACYPSVAELPVPVDLAVLAVRAEAAAGLVRECAAAGIAHGVLWAGGFGETGAEGAARQAELTAACRETGFTLLGPNCIGFIGSDPACPATFASFLAEYQTIAPGVVSMVTHSGGLGTQAQALAQRAGTGFRRMVSTGNEADVTAAEVIAALAADPGTRVIAAYLEGIADGPEFVRALELARDRHTPLVVLKGGSVPASAQAALAHTGALAGEDRVLRSVLAEFGAVAVSSLEELLDTALYLASLAPGTLPRGNLLAVVTFGGGGGVLAADQAARAGLTTPSLAPATQDVLRELLPPIASLANPVDATPQTFNQPQYLDRFGDALCTVAADPGIDSVLALFGPMSRGTDEVIDALLRLRAESGRTVAVAWPFCPEPVRLRLLAEGFHPFEEPARAIAALGRATAHAASLADPAPPPASPVPPAVPWAEYLPDARPGAVLPEPACHAILAQAGLPIARGTLVADRSALDAALVEVGFPVVLKGISAEVTHRDAAGLVAVGLGDGTAAWAAYDRLTDRAAAAGIRLDGIYVQHFESGGVELLVSAFRDPVFGPVVSCGAGGTLTEVIDDLALARGPLDSDGARRLLERLRIVRYALAHGRADGLDRVSRFVADFSQLAASAPWSRAILEVNPVKWRAADVVAVDGLVIVEQP